MIKVFEPPVYCYHEIVHNRLVVDSFRSRGVIFVDDIDDVPPGAPLMLSAHGSAPAVLEQARSNGGAVVDAVCPLVTKVHHEVKVRSRKGYTILYVGHAGHEETIGTMAVAPESVKLLEDDSDIDSLDDSGPDRTKVALLAQTTLSVDEWSGLMKSALDKFPDLWMPGRSDLCFATTNRQAALKEISANSDVVVVIGSANSSNTLALEQVAIGSGCPRVIRVNQASELPDDLCGVVGVTAGASAPESLVQEVLTTLSPRLGVEEVQVVSEEEYFPPPPELRELLRGLANALWLFSGTGAKGSPGDPVGADRQTPAARILTQIVS